MLRRFAVALVLCVGCAQAQAPVDLRVALVIGNSAYATAPLLNPANDAGAIGEALRGMGFTVIEVRDASRARMQEAIAQVGSVLKGRHGIGMLYYAGHGLQLDWRNYMVPVDARIAKASDVAEQTVDVQTVIDAFRAAGNRMNILVLDACRDNPFAQTASGKGLAPMDAPTSTLLAYATAPGNVAEDGDTKSGNGLYTQFLVQEIKEPGARIEDVFKRVRFQVRERSQGRQIPWESTSLEDDFSFGTGIKPFVRLEGRAREQAFNQEKADWDRIADSKNPDDFYAFLKKYPSGNVAELAQARLDRVQAAAIKPQPDRDGPVAVEPQRRFRDGDRYEFVLKDGYSGVVTSNTSVAVKAIGDDLFEASDGGPVKSRFTGAGFILADKFGTYDPPLTPNVPGEIRVGKKWSQRVIRTEHDGSRYWLDLEAHVVAREKVTVPLGTVDTYRVEVDFVLQNGTRVKFTYWDDPAWGYSIKVHSIVRSPRSPPSITIREMSAHSRAG